MKISITLKMALITATLGNASFAMQHTPLTLNSVFFEDMSGGGLANCLAPYLGPTDKNSMLEVSTEINQSIDQTIRNLVVKELNEDSLARITNAANWLLSLEIKRINYNIIDALTFPEFPLLKTLRLRWTNISGNDMQTIIQHCPNLEELSVYLCLNAPASIIQTLQENKDALPHLKSLDLSFTDISADNMQAIIEHCPKLEELNVSNCRQAPEGIIQALKANPNVLLNLKKLNLSYTDISADNMQTIIQDCQNLEELDVVCCFTAPENIIQALQENPLALQHLKRLYLCRPYTSTETAQINFIQRLIPYAKIMSIN